MDPIATPPAPKTTKPKATKIAGSSFVPDLAANRVAVAESRWYWVGVTPGCPTESLDCAGINFPKITELIQTGLNGQQQRVPAIGGLCKLTRSQVELMREKMSRTVIRFQRPKTAEEEGAEVQFQDQPQLSRPARKGQLIRIPTAAEIAEREKNGFPTVRYEQSPLDEPAACHMFAEACADQNRPRRGSFYPPPLSETGLVWDEA
jgi:hypothetical protein